MDRISCWNFPFANEMGGGGVGGDGDDDHDVDDGCMQHESLYNIVEFLENLTRADWKWKQLFKNSTQYLTRHRTNTAD